MSFLISRAPITRCRVVYFGPPGAGKATSLRYVYANINPLRKGELRQRARGRDQILELSFDVRIRSSVARVSLATVSGPVTDPQIFVEVLEGVHGLVLVADSSPTAFGANLRSLQLVEQALGVTRRRLASIPHVHQYNKRDLDDALPIAELDDALNRYAVPSFATVATEGRDVEDALVSVTAGIIDTSSQDRAGGATEPPGRESQPELTPLERAERQNLKQRLARQRRREEIDKALELASRFFEQDDLTECLRWARKALEHDPEHTRARDLYDRAKAKLDELVERLYDDAVAARDDGDLAGAAERAEHALELHPHHRGFELLLSEVRALTRRAIGAGAPESAAAVVVSTPARAVASASRAEPTRDSEAEQDEHKAEVVALIRQSEDLLRRAEHRGALEILAQLEARADRLGASARGLVAALEQRRRAVFEALKQRARSRLTAGDYDRALEDLTLLLEHDAQDAQALALVDQVGTAIIARAASNNVKPARRDGDEPEATGSDRWDLAARLEPSSPRRKRGG